GVSLPRGLIGGLRGLLRSGGLHHDLTLDLIGALHVELFERVERRLLLGGPLGELLGAFGGPGSSRGLALLRARLRAVLVAFALRRLLRLSGAGLAAFHLGLAAFRGLLGAGLLAAGLSVLLGALLALLGFPALLLLAGGRLRRLHPEAVHHLL